MLEQNAGDPPALLKTIDNALPRQARWNRTTKQQIPRRPNSGLRRDDKLLPHRRKKVDRRSDSPTILVGSPQNHDGAAIWRARERPPAPFGLRRDKRIAFHHSLHTTILARGILG